MFLADQFPGCMGLEYVDDEGNLPIAVTCQQGELLMPENGWVVANRIYRCVYAKPVESSSTVSSEASASTSSSKWTSLIIACNFLGTE